jgi:hypothetical protein
LNLEASLSLGREEFSNFSSQVFNFLLISFFNPGINSRSAGAGISSVSLFSQSLSALVVNPPLRDAKSPQTFFAKEGLFQTSSVLHVPMFRDSVY